MNTPDTITVSEEEYREFSEQLRSLEAKLDLAIEILESYGISLD